MALSEGYYWFKAANEEWEVCRIIAIRDSLCAFFFFGRQIPIPVEELIGDWVEIEPPASSREKEDSRPFD